MPTNVLIPPDQRLLGSALGDLTLYGAQPTAGEAPARTDGMTSAAQPPLTPAPSADHAIGTEAQPVGVTVPVPSSGGFVTSSPIAPAAFHAAAFAPVTAPATPAAAPVGAGSFTAQPLAFELHGLPAHVDLPAPPEQIAEPAALAASTAVAPATLAGVTAAAVPVVELTTGVADHLSDALQAIAPDAATALDGAPAALDHLANVAPSIAAVEPIAATALDTVTAVADHLVDTPLAATAASIAATALDAAAPVMDHLADPMAITAPVVDTLGAAAATVTTTADTAAAGASPVTSGLEGLAGSDPTAGIHTLVGMVQTADAFDLSHATSPEAAPAPSIVDALSADEASSSLLGDAHHDLAGIGHLTDTHAAHLGL